METKARYILVGACTLLAVALLFALVRLNRGGKSSSEDLKQYSIYFKGGVFGLSTGSSVLFNGVRIGSVTDIRLASPDQSMVQVIIEISSKAVMRQDCQAMLLTQGITGLSAVYISGGSSLSPPLETMEGEELPVIPAEKSSLEKLALAAPEVLDSVSALSHALTTAVSPENVANLRLSLENLAAFSGRLAEQSGKLEESLNNMSQASLRLNRVLESADKVLEVDFHEAGLSAKQAFEHMDRLLARLEPDLSKISATSLEGLTRLFADTSQLVRNLDDLIRSLQNNPGALLWGGAYPEYRPP
jgi:phospholipid/cholesterol/gamma-HCH transport system substrate-binding protein